jgi:hypothetical protein
LDGVKDAGAASVPRLKLVYGWRGRGCRPNSLDDQCVSRGPLQRGGDDLRVIDGLGPAAAWLIAEAINPGSGEPVAPLDDRRP